MPEERFGVLDAEPAKNPQVRKLTRRSHAELINPLKEEVTLRVARPARSDRA